MTAKEARSRRDRFEVRVANQLELLAGGRHDLAPRRHRRFALEQRRAQLSDALASPPRETGLQFFHALAAVWVCSRRHSGRSAPPTAGANGRLRRCRRCAVGSAASNRSAVRQGRPSLQQGRSGRPAGMAGRSTPNGSRSMENSEAGFPRRPPRRPPTGPTALPPNASALWPPWSPSQSPPCESFELIGHATFETPGPYRTEIPAPPCATGRVRSLTTRSRRPATAQQKIVLGRIQS